MASGKLLRQLIKSGAEGNMFCGPPGCGKPLSAEVLASELGIPLAIVRIDRVVSSYLGETASNLRQVLDFAAAMPVMPCD